MTFYRTTHSSIHAGIAHSLIAAHAERSCLLPTTSRASYKTPCRSDNPACMSDSLVFTRNCSTAFPLNCRRRVPLSTANRRICRCNKKANHLDSLLSLLCTIWRQSRVLPPCSGTLRRSSAISRVCCRFLWRKIRNSPTSPYEKISHYF